jgi:hypothetical protein
VKSHPHAFRELVSVPPTSPTPKPLYESKPAPASIVVYQGYLSAYATGIDAHHKTENNPPPLHSPPSS